MIKHFEQNIKGKDYVVGDIHGCFDLLRLWLAELNFDETKDRLFSTGDLVDRGPKSEECLDWLSKPWFHAVLGNHEQMAIDYQEGFYMESLYLRNGGAWFISLPEVERQEYRTAFRELPVAIDIKTSDGLVGIIHADCPVDDWNTLSSPHTRAHTNLIKEASIWGRDRYFNRDTSIVKNVDRIFVGHTVVKEDTVLGNVRYIDNGAVFGGSLKLHNVDDLWI